jgi:hypothetical protein
LWRSCGQESSQDGGGSWQTVNLPSGQQIGLGQILPMAASGPNELYLNWVNPGEPDHPLVAASDNGGQSWLTLSGPWGSPVVTAVYCGFTRDDLAIREHPDSGG